MASIAPQLFQLGDEDEEDPWEWSEEPISASATRPRPSTSARDRLATSTSGTENLSPRQLPDLNSTTTTTSQEVSSAHEKQSVPENGLKRTSATSTLLEESREKRRRIEEPLRDQNSILPSSNSLPSKGVNNGSDMIVDSNQLLDEKPYINRTAGTSGKPNVYSEWSTDAKIYIGESQAISAGLGLTGSPPKDVEPWQVGKASAGSVKPRGLPLFIEIDDDDDEPGVPNQPMPPPYPPPQHPVYRHQLTSDKKRLEQRQESQRLREAALARKSRRTPATGERLSSSSKPTPSIKREAQYDRNDEVGTTRPRAPDFSTSAKIQQTSSRSRAIPRDAEIISIASTSPKSTTNSPPKPTPPGSPTPTGQKVSSKLKTAEQAPSISELSKAANKSKPRLTEVPPLRSDASRSAPVSIPAKSKTKSGGLEIPPKRTPIPLGVQSDAHGHIRAIRADNRWISEQGIQIANNEVDQAASRQERSAVRLRKKGERLERLKVEHDRKAVAQGAQAKEVTPREDQSIQDVVRKAEQAARKEAKELSAAKARQEEERQKQLQVEYDRQAATREAEAKEATRREEERKREEQRRQSEVQQEARLRKELQDRQAESKRKSDLLQAEQEKAMAIRRAEREEAAALEKAERRRAAALKRAEQEQSAAAKRESDMREHAAAKQPSPPSSDEAHDKVSHQARLSNLPPAHNLGANEISRGENCEQPDSTRDDQEHYGYDLLIDSPDADVPTPTILPPSTSGPVSLNSLAGQQRLQSVRENEAHGSSTQAAKPKSPPQRLAEDEQNKIQALRGLLQTSGVQEKGADRSSAQATRPKSMLQMLADDKQNKVSAPRPRVVLQPPATDDTLAVKKKFGRTVTEIYAADLQLLEWRDKDNLQWATICEAFQKHVGVARSEDTLRCRYRAVKQAVEAGNISRAILDKAVWRDQEALRLINDKAGFRSTSRKESSAGTPLRTETPLDIVRESTEARFEPVMPSSNVQKPAVAMGEASPEAMARPTTGGKTLNANFWQIMLGDVLKLREQEEAEEAQNEEAAAAESSEGEEETAGDEDYCHYTYSTTQRKITQLELDDDVKIEDKDWIVSIVLYEEVENVERAVRRAVDQLLPGDEMFLESPRTVEYTEDKYGLPRVTIRKQDEGILEIGVERTMRTYQDQIAPRSKKGWIPATLYQVLERSESQTKNSTSGKEKHSLAEFVVGDVAYTHSGLANKAAIDRFIKKTFRASVKTSNLDAISRERTAMEERLVEELDDGELFSGQEGEIAVWVRPMKTSGPRNG